MAKSRPESAQLKLTLAEYDRRAQAANQLKDSADARDQLRFGLFGEIGGVLAAVKKTHRDLGPAVQVQVTEELGDGLWYLATVASQYGHSLAQVGEAALVRLRTRLEINHVAEGGELTFHEFDGLLDYCHRQLDAMHRATCLRELAAHAGQLMTGDAHQDLASGSILSILGDVLADLAVVAALFKVPMKKIAADNLAKFESRWPGPDAEYYPLFDEGRSSIERFPREFSIYFIQRFTEDDKPYVIQQLNNVNIGDRLTDNKTEADGYRFHDVFHLAYVAHLGWSPVLRALLKLKRKSDDDLDENQDGARAMIIEEGIATWIFNHAYKRDYYENTPIGKLEYGLLKQVTDMVQGYEVAKCPPWQWERAILDGFRVFRELRDAESGIVTVDMNKHTITFQKLEGEAEKDFKPKRRADVAASAVPPRPPSSTQ